MNMLIMAIVNVLNMIIQIYIFIVIARALVSWVNPDPYNPIVRFLHSATDPALYRIRKLMPFLSAGGFDLSPIVLLILLSLVQQMLPALLFGLR